MRNNPVVYGVLGLLVGAFITYLFTSSMWFGPMQTGMMPMMGLRQDVRPTMMADIDRHFIEQMIPHHEGAIDMAELAKDLSQNPNILELADAILVSQTAEIDQMKAWYQDWYGSEVPVETDIHMGMGRGIMHGGMMDMNADIEALEQATDFDRAFLEEMIPHHQMAVMMAQMLQSGTTRPEMVQLARDIIEEQESEIELMRSWLQE